MDSRILAIIFSLTLLFVTRTGRERPAPAIEKSAMVSVESEKEILPSPSPSPTPPPSPSPLPSPIPSPIPAKPAPPQIGAKSAGLDDLDSGEIFFEKESDLPLAIASLTKLMTAVIAAENLSPETEITISAEDIVLENHQPSLEPGDRLTRDEALYFMLIFSDNGVAQAVSRAASLQGDFVGKMNAKAKELGMHQTFFTNPTGLDGNISTVRDLVTLTRYIATSQPFLFDISRQRSVTIISTQGKTYELKNTNMLLDKIPGILGGKTGYTPEAQGSLVLLFEIGKRRLVSVVLGAEDRFADTQELFRWYWKNHFVTSQ